MSEDIGKKAEKKIKEWLDRPQDGYCFDRIPDQLSGMWGSRNICDFTLYKYPNFYYIESKATYHDRFDFTMLSDYQHDEMLKKADIGQGVRSLVIVLFATYKRAFIVDIRTIRDLEEQGTKSFNIKFISKWKFPYKEITTVPNNRKSLLDYTGNIENFIPEYTKED